MARGSQWLRVVFSTRMSILFRRYHLPPIKWEKRREVNCSTCTEHIKSMNSLTEQSQIAQLAKSYPFSPVVTLLRAGTP